MGENIDERKVVGYKTANGEYIVFVKTAPKVVGRGNTPEEALDDLNDTYNSILRAVAATVAATPCTYE